MSDLSSTDAADARFMRLAIDAAMQGVAKGQSPFGACIVKDGAVVACTHNVVWLTTDITAHAEIHCLRQACLELGAIDLSGCTIYSTTEPCPMCFSAIHWARIERIVFGTSIADAEAAGFNELAVSNETLRDLGQTSVEIVPGFLRDECQAVFDTFNARIDKATY